MKHQNNVPDVALFFLLLTLNIFQLWIFSYVSIIDFGQVNASWKSIQEWTKKNFRKNTFFRRGTLPAEFRR